MTDVPNGSSEIIIAEETAARSDIFSNVRVKSGGILVLFALLAGDLIVEEGGAATIHGRVRGSVVNLGGTVAIEASASCLAVVDEGAASSRIEEGAIVSFGRINCDKGDATMMIADVTELNERSVRGRG